MGVSWGGHRDGGNVGKGDHRVHGKYSSLNFKLASVALIEDKE